LALRLMLAVVARARGVTVGPLTVPEPWGGLLDLNGATALSTLWVLLAQAGPTTEALGRHVLWRNTIGTIVAISVLTWSAFTYTSIRAAGVTASDPYAYVQMAVDLVEGGTPLHTFDLAPRVAEWGLPLWPLVPVGYRPPDPQTGVAATVWPPGHSALLALSYKWGGEGGLYLLTPLLGLVTLIAMGWLSLEVLRSWQDGWPLLAAGVAVFVLATSYQQVVNLAVPMADIPSQLFTILSVGFALRASRGQTYRCAALSGLCWGAAFAVRYTQVLLAGGILFLLRPHLWLRSRRRALLAAICCGVAAWLVALPTLWYHTVAFGGPCRVGSSELTLFGGQHVPQAFVSVVKDLLRTNEFLYLVPFLAWGALRLWRSARRAASALLIWLVTIVAFHLPYEALRARDLLSVFPVLALWAGVGVTDVLAQVQRIGRPLWRGGAQVLSICSIVFLLWARTRFMLPLAALDVPFNTFGYLNAEQRAAFDTLARLTPSDAIVAASLNSGPIGLYADRQTLRPAYWSQEEWLDFVVHVLNDGYRLYLLVDGTEMREPLQTVQSRYLMVLVAYLPMPYFFPGGHSDNLSVPLYKVIR
jgi:hypothetical protein